MSLLEKVGNSTETDTSFFEVYFNLTFDHTSTSEVLKNGEKVLQKGVNLRNWLILLKIQPIFGEIWKIFTLFRILTSYFCILFI